MLPHKTTRSALAIHLPSLSTPRVILALHGLEGNEASFFSNWRGIPPLRLKTLGVPSKKPGSWVMMWLCKIKCCGTLLRYCHQNRGGESNFTLNRALITVGNFSLLPIIYLQRIFLKGAIWENSVQLWCFQVTH